MRKWHQNFYVTSLRTTCYSIVLPLYLVHFQEIFFITLANFQCKSNITSFFRLHVGIWRGLRSCNFRKEERERRKNRFDLVLSVYFSCRTARYFVILFVVSIHSSTMQFICAKSVSLAWMKGSNYLIVGQLSIINWVENVNWPPWRVLTQTFRAFALRQSEWLS